MFLNIERGFSINISNLAYDINIFRARKPNKPQLFWFYFSEWGSWLTHYNTSASHWQALRNSPSSFPPYHSISQWL